VKDLPVSDRGALPIAMEEKCGMHRPLLL
jgi:hypothetical protein